MYHELKLVLRYVLENLFGGKSEEQLHNFKTQIKKGWIKLDLIAFKYLG